MATSEIDDRVVQLVREKWKGANVKGVQISDRIPNFLRGYLYIVSIYDAHGDEHENYVYALGESLRRFDDLKHLAADVAHDSALAQFFQSSFEFVGISGVVAVVITLTICYLAIAGQKPEPFLANALTSILGFYFGTTVHSASKSRRDS
jgi:hypothetical protein